MSFSGRVTALPEKWRGKNQNTLGGAKVPKTVPMTHALRIRTHGSASLVIPGVRPIRPRGVVQALVVASLH
jgi:hypothetical protein